MPMKRTFTKWWAILMLLTTVFLVPLTASAKKIYLDPGPWDTAGAWFSAWVWGSAQPDAWCKATSGTPYYTIEVPDDATEMHLIRFASSCTVESWNGGDIWNRMDNIKLGADNQLTITGWDAGNFSWSNFDPSGPITYVDLYLKGEDINGWTNNDAWKLTTTDGDNYAIEFQTATALTGKFKVADAGWTDSKTWGGAAEGVVIEANTPTVIAVGNGTKDMTFAADISATRVDFVISTKTLTITTVAPEPEPEPVITVTPDQVAFEEITVGESATATVTYTYDNTEKPAIAIEGAGFSYEDAEGTITITFTPEAAGEFEGTLTIGEGEFAKVVALTGAAKEAEKPVDPVSNLVIPEFAETTVGQTTTVTATFDVNNVIGLAPQLLDNPSGYFTMGAPVYPEGGVGQASIEITFAPNAAGTFSANLYMPYAGGGLVQQVFSATAVAGGDEPGPGPEPAKPVDNIVIPAFAETTVGSTTTVTATFDVNKVEGLVPQLLDNTSGFFSMGQPVMPDGGVGTATIEITFAPTEAGTFSANLYLAYAGGLQQQIFSATAVAAVEPEPEPEPEPENVTITFVNFEGWDAVKFHAWGGTAAGTEWPGLDMTKSEETLYDASIYSISFESGAYASCIFNNGAGTQTGNLTLNESKPVYANGVWYASLDDVPNPETAAATLWLKGDVNTWNGGDEWQFATTDGENYVLEFAEATALTGEFKIGDATFATYNFGAAEGEEAIAAGKAYTLASGSMANLVFAENLTASKIEFVLSTATLTITAATTPEPEPIVITIGEAPEIGEVTVGQSATVFVDYTVNSEEQPEVNIDNDAFVASIAEANKVEIIFTPTEAKEYTATLTLAIGEVEATLELTATGVAAEEPVVPVSNIVIPAFAETTVGSTTTVTATFDVNKVEGLVPQLLDNTSGFFSMGQPVMPDGGVGTATIEITFAPTEAGTFSANLYLAYAGGLQQQIFSATAVAGGDEPEPENVTITFVNFEGWDAVKFHAWGGTAAGTEWPGLDMTKSEETLYDASIYTISFESGAYTSCIFNNGAGTQTDDLAFDESKPVYANGVWYASLDEVPAPEPGPTPEPEMLTLYYVNNQGWGEVATYAWDVNPIAEWPGELATKTDLTAKGYDVYSYTFDASKAVNIIFNNNNNGSQTDNLTIDPSKPYFYIDQWYASLEEIEATSIEELAAYNIYATEGTIYADTEFAIYNLAGIDVTAQNGALQGNYIVKTEKGSLLISVW